MRSAAATWVRGRNALRRLRAGLRLQAESVSPETQNDLFQAHLSIYHFFGRFARGGRVLDIGTGAGYGAALLHQLGAREVVAFDVDARSIRYAARRYRQPGLRFLVGDAMSFPEGLGTFDLVVSSNVFEHLDDPGPALAAVVAHLEKEGEFVLVVPPITDAASLEANLANRFHKSNLTVWEWLDLLTRRFREVKTYRHGPPHSVRLDFASPFASRVDPTAFVFEEHAASDLGRLLTLGAVFACRLPAGDSR